MKLREFFEQKPVRGRVNREYFKEFSKVLHANADPGSGFISKQRILLISDLEKICRIISACEMSFSCATF